MLDTFNLQRFVQAQTPVLGQVERELAAGHKATHWMWFVFPQLSGLGHSAMAQRYAIGSTDEADAYMHHELLGTRLLRCTALVNGVAQRSARQIFGTPDDMKFRSSMTLFAHVAPGESLFRQALAKYFDGQADLRTIEALASG